MKNSSEKAICVRNSIIEFIAALRTFLRESRDASTGLMLEFILLMSHDEAL